MNNTEDLLRESLDFVLQQQLLSENYSIINRTKDKTMIVAGTKAVYEKLRQAIQKGFHFIQKGNINAFISFLSKEFNIDKQIFQTKLKGLLDQGLELDSRMIFIQVAGVLREYWQNVVYENVINDVRSFIKKRYKTIPETTYKQINRILSEKYNQLFSMMMNLYTVRIWGNITNVPFKSQGKRLGILNKLSALVAAEIRERK